MSSLTRALTGRHLAFGLAEQVGELRAEDRYRQTGRLGRTLVKEGALRLTLTVLAQGAEVGTHHAAAPMTLQVLEGRLQYRLDPSGAPAAGAPAAGAPADVDAPDDVPPPDEVRELAAGELLFFGPGHARDIRALQDTALLLTITGGDEG